MKLKIVVCLLLLSVSSYGQKYGNVWEFGYHAGIDFNSCNPVPLTKGNNSGFEGCSAISDSGGNLLFYTNSDSVWNKLDVPMSNGHLLSTSGTLSQVLIIPKPLSNSVYYIITTMIQGQGSLRLEYHIVDMTLDGGLGDVVSKNNILSNDTITEQVAATFHANDQDIWLMVHQYGTNNFLSYLVTAAGISAVPVISSCGAPIIPCSSNMNARGEMKFSPDGTKIALNNNGAGNDLNSDYLSVFNFNNNTGLVTSPINLPPERGGFGISFSPDNSKLYGATWKAFNFQITDSEYVFQFDLSSNDSLTIVNSKKIIYSAPITQENFGAMKLAPNGKIYLSYFGASYIAVINSPNEAGELCNYVNEGFYLGSKTCQMGLNNYIEYKDYCDSTTTIASLSNNIISPFPNPAQSQLTINLPTPINDVTIRVYDVQGRMIALPTTFTNTQTQLNTTTLPDGFYTLQITNNKTGASEVGKFVKQ